MAYIDQPLVSKKRVNISIQFKCVFDELIFAMWLYFRRKPRRCWRRTLDVVVVRIAISYHATLALQSNIFVPYGIVWLIFAIFALLLYIFIRGLSRRLMHFEASLLHLCMHVLGVVANTILYRYLQSQQYSNSIKIFFFLLSEQFILHPSTRIDFLIFV